MAGHVHVRMRLTAGLVVAALVTSGLSMAAAPAGAKPGKIKPPPVQKERVLPHEVFNPRLPSGNDNTKLGRRSGTEWPTGAKGADKIAASTQPTQVGGTPVLVGRGASANSGIPVAASVKGRSVTAKAGVDGVLFTVDTSESLTESITVGLDYSSFTNVVGGAYGARLRLVSLPSCSLSTPERDECRVQSELASANDAVRQRVSALVPIPAAEHSGSESEPGEATADEAVSDGAPLVIAAVADTAGETGSFKATSLAPSGSWSVSGAAGSFSWSYPVPVTGAPGSDSATPQVGLSYNSASVDGKTTGTNNQPSQMGEGWDYNPGYIERSYRTCSDFDELDPDEQTGPPVWETGDLCWAGQILTLNLGGKTTRLVKDSAGKWHPERDDAERITFETGANNDAPNGEHWVVTTTDGVKYHFGRGNAPGRAEPTNSAWTVPVVGAHVGDPCHKNGDRNGSRCPQVWRWNLDYVEDPTGNAVAYHYQVEKNHYNAAIDENGTNLVQYTRAGSLDRIDYGMRNNNGVVSAATRRVQFDLAERCIPVEGGFDCAAEKLNQTNAYHWADTPYDLLCDGAGECKNHSPSFWSRKRLEMIRTQYLSAGSYVDIDWIKLTHEFPTSGEDALTLKAITRTGRAPDGSQIVLPATTFTNGPRANRVPVGGGPEMYFPRMTQINTDTGQAIKIQYNGDPGQAGRAKPQCTATTVPSDLANNTTMCYPVKTAGLRDNDPISKEYFRKYVVTQVDVDEGHQLAPTRTTTYTYVGDPAWHFDDNELVREKLRTYAQFRGYRTVQTRTGSPNATTHGVPDKWTLSTATYLRGMGGTVADSLGDEHSNADEFADALLETRTFLGDSATVVEGTIKNWGIVKTTAIDPRAGLPDLTARIVRSNQSRKVSYPAAGGTKLATTTSIFDDRGRAIRVSETGTDVNPRCTYTDYAEPPEGSTLWVLSKPAEVKSTDEVCSPIGTPGNVTSHSKYFYDNSDVLGVIPDGGAGLNTKTLKAVNSSGRFARATATYDAHGRAISTTAFAASGDTSGRTIETTYAPPIGGPVTKVTVKNPLNQTTITDLAPGRGAPTRSEDIAGLVTSATYDPLGRVTAVWTPGQTKGTDPATVTYGYKIDDTATPPLALTTKTLVDTGTSTNYVTSMDLFDGNGALRQTQTDAVNGGRVISDNFTDSHGWTTLTNERWFTPGAPAAEILTTDWKGLGSRTLSHYDGTGRVVRTERKQGPLLRATTQSIYGGDRVTVIPPTGGTTTTTLSDVRGQMRELRRWTGTPTINGNVVTGTSFKTTRYDYDTLGRQTTITSQPGHKWIRDYDLAGRVVETTDPDAGVSISTYNDYGDLTSTKNANEQVLSYTYDDLGRKVAEHHGGTKLTSWLYDTKQRGMLTESTSYANGKAYTVGVTGYTPTGQPTGTVVTLTEPGLSDSYATKLAWTSTGLLKQQTLAATTMPSGGEPAEAIDYKYDQWGNQLSEIGLNSYVSGTGYSPYGEANIYTIGVNPLEAKLQYERDEMTRQVTSVVFAGQTAPSQLERIDYEYNAYGNIIKTVDTQGGWTTSPVETQCFTYTSQNQLKQAWSSLDSCATTPSTTDNSKVGGPQKFWTGWTYDDAGNRKTQTQYAVPGVATPTTVTDYTMAAPGHAHAVSTASTKVGTAAASSLAFNYDANGNMVERGTPTGTQLLEYDQHNRTKKIAVGGTAVNYVYDADGNQLIRRDGDVTTLYLPGQEVTYSSTTDKTNVTKYYSHNGVVVAMRKNAGNPTYLMSDHHGSMQVSVSPVTWTVSRRYLDPHGNTLQTKGTWPDLAHGFLGKPQSDVTGLTDVGARKYDGTLGRFISVDPVLVPDDPSQLNGYQYGGNNPVNNSDPTGLQCADVCGGGVRSDPGPTPSEGSGNSPSDEGSQMPSPAEPAGAQPSDDPIAPPLKGQIIRDGQGGKKNWAKDPYFGPFYIAGEVIGINDGVRCIFMGSGMGCAWAVAALPVGPLKPLIGPLRRFKNLDEAIAGVEAAGRSSWDLPAHYRGLALERRYARDPLLPSNFKTFDSFANGHATSIKSIDTSRISDSRVTSRVNSYIRQVSRFTSEARGGVTLRSGDITSREVQVLLPSSVGYDYGMAVALNRSFDYGAERGVKVTYMFVN